MNRPFRRLRAAVVSTFAALNVLAVASLPLGGAAAANELYEITWDMSSNSTLTSTCPIPSGGTLTDVVESVFSGRQKGTIGTTSGSITTSGFTRLHHFSTVKGSEDVKGADDGELTTPFKPNTDTSVRVKKDAGGAVVIPFSSFKMQFIGPDEYRVPAMKVGNTITIPTKIDGERPPAHPKPDSKGCTSTSPTNVTGNLTIHRIR